MLSSYQLSKLNEGIDDCDRFIAIEGPRSADLRPASVQQHLDFCVEHKQKLQGMIDRNEWFPSPWIS